MPKHRACARKYANDMPDKTSQKQTKAGQTQASNRPEVLTPPRLCRKTGQEQAKKKPDKADQKHARNRPEVLKPTRLCTTIAIQGLVNCKVCAIKGPRFELSNCWKLSVLLVIYSKFELSNGGKWTKKSNQTFKHSGHTIETLI